MPVPTGSQSGGGYATAQDKEFFVQYLRSSASLRSQPTSMQPEGLSEADDQPLVLGTLGLFHKPFVDDRVQYAAQRAQSAADGGEPGAVVPDDNLLYRSRFYSHVLEPQTALTPHRVQKKVVATTTSQLGDIDASFSDDSTCILNSSTRMETSDSEECPSSVEIATAFDSDDDARKNSKNSGTNFTLVGGESPSWSATKPRSAAARSAHHHPPRSLSANCRPCTYLGEMLWAYAHSTPRRGTALHRSHSFDLELDYDDLLVSHAPRGTGRCSSRTLHEKVWSYEIHGGYGDASVARRHSHMRFSAQAAPMIGGHGLGSSRTVREQVWAYENHGSHGNPGVAARHSHMSFNPQGAAKSGSGSRQ
eukprot:gnl/TRDRNA2_/TRDRNA2_90893_c0_seq1.p1 gnl/TRDRNA2_/TRDRNA2_90893_c0~~gnl/TRDRNA2_/TRDRNA2_90893_c0_seq1.p1  ORF type:complete len:363 (+),score=32.20 gnl/TRDRNA2_/TRDRNA2_90893_c0_seq1:78-1166(+)